MLREAAQSAAHGQTVFVVGLRQYDLERLRSIARDTLGPLVTGQLSDGDLVVGLGVLHFVSAAKAGLDPFDWNKLAGGIPGHTGPLYLDHAVFDAGGPDARQVLDALTWTTF